MPVSKDTAKGPRTIKSFKEQKPDFFKIERKLKEIFFKLSIEKELSELKVNYRII